MRKAKLNVILTPAAKELVLIMAKDDRRSAGAVLEELIRREAKRRKLPTPKAEKEDK